MNDKLLKIGVIGAGGRGGLSRNAVLPGVGGKIVALCDTDPDAFKKYEGVCDENVYKCSDYRDLLARPEVEAVFVCTPDYLHEEHAIAALQAGKHVYLEKPMAITIEGCDKILNEARKSGKKLYLGHNMRHMRFVQKMKELVDSGAIGKVKAAWCRHFIAYGGDAYFKDWHAEREKGTGLLLQKAAHDIDVLHWICGGYTTRVVGQGWLTLYDQITDRHPDTERGDATFRNENWPPLSQKQLNPVIDVEDISHILMQLDNGVFATYQQCHFTPDAWRNYTIIGTEGRIENLGENKVALWNTRCYYKAEGDEQFDCTPEGGSHGGADPMIVAEFVRYVREGGNILTSPIAARNSVAAGYLGTMSIRSGSTPYNIPPVNAELVKYFS
jgi:predicted dehydrogenase